MKKQTRAGLVLAAALAALGPFPSAGDAAARGRSHDVEAKGPRPWCAPEVTELADHVCYFDGEAPEATRHTLVIYLHGALATTPGFQYLQQRAMALHAEHHHFTVLIPTSPLTKGSYVWPTSEAAQKEEEADIVAGLAKDRTLLEARLHRKFDEVFVVGFSSGAYYASSLALRGALDVDGYVVLAGGGSWARTHAQGGKRAPVFVGVSLKDKQTRDHSRSFGATLAALGWPVKIEARPAGHMVDWTFMAHGIGWLRARALARDEAKPRPAHADGT